ncbi:MAG: hypothetical protein AAF789_02215 [Bacteroidota bacterium]
MKSVLSIFLIFLCMQLVFAQGFDQARMDRDLEVAENILVTLSDSERRSFWRESGVESSYIPDFGVIFTMQRNSLWFYNNEVFSTAVGKVRDKGIVVIEDEDAGDVKMKINGRRVKVLDSDDDEAETIKSEANKEMANQATVFLADYANLIGQLNPSDKVVVRFTSNQPHTIFFGSNEKQAAGDFTAEVVKSDLTALAQGKIDRDDLIDRIKISISEEKEVERDVKLFATIFARLYEPDLSTTYYLAGRNISYTALDGLGVTFNLKFYSSSSNDGLHSIRTTGQKGLTKEERDEIVNDMYSSFEQTFKENVLDYGRTVKSLKENEKLIFKVKLTECNSCEMPDEIEVMIDAKTLMAYDKGTLSRSKALGMVKVNSTKS